MENLWCRNRRELGKKGEDLALEYLLQRGMRLLARNWRSGRKELDLVMEEENTIRFVEVRTRECPSIIDPFESVNAVKQRKVISAAKGFLAAKGKEGYLSGGKEAAFDVVSILFNGELFEIKYIREAFGPSW
jgi:putative endonuclease